MKKDSRILVLGGAGMVGSAILRGLLAEGFYNLHATYYSRGAAPKSPEPQQGGGAVSTTRIDLTHQDEVERLFDQVKPDYVFLAAGKVGGIRANEAFPAEFISVNLAIQVNVIRSAFQARVKRFLLLGSSCIYPRLATQPIKEEYLLSGPLEATNEPYAIAKIAGIKMCEAYNRQYGMHFAALMPTNLYGPGDDFYSENSHVLPALLRRFHQAKITGADKVVVWGSGDPRREFLHVDDLASASLFVMSLDEARFSENFLSYPTPCFVNVGTGEDVTVREVALTVRRIVGVDCELTFDLSRPDGTPRKLLDVSRLADLGWRFKIDLESGLSDTYEWFLRNQTPTR